MSMLQSTLQSTKTIPINEVALHQALCGITMNQMSAKAGIKKHGQAAINALFKEFAQLNNITVFAVLDASKLSAAQKRAALRAINVIKEKRNGILKGRACADGHSQ
ncbi:hypothetical protein ACA910_016933 [Epithemia clementina (nom. ined.)]